MKYVKDDQSMTKYMLLENMETTHVANLVFSPKQTDDYIAVIKIRFSTNEIISIVFSAHVHSDPVLISPTVIDFGVLPVGFEALRVPVSA